MELIEIISAIFLVLLSGMIVTDVEETEIVNEIEIIVNETIVEPIPLPNPVLTLKQTKYPEHWTCFDFAMNYSELHPEWVQSLFQIIHGSRV